MSIEHECRFSGGPINVFRGGWAISGMRWSMTAHWWKPPLGDDGLCISLCGRAAHRNVYNRDGSVRAGMLGVGDGNRCKLCARMAGRMKLAALPGK